MSSRDDKLNEISGYGPVRVSPVQLRSAKRVTLILDAAAEYVQEHGLETLTTAALTEGSRASIGTIYRYFPDRLSMLQTLAGRNLQRAVEKLQNDISTAAPSTLEEGLDVVLDCLVDLFRNEPGYRSLRVGDPLDLRPVTEARMGNQHLAQVTIDEFSEQLGTKFDSEARLALQTGFDALDGLLARAFLHTPKGDRAYLTQARRIFRLIVIDGLS